MAAKSTVKPVMRKMNYSTRSVTKAQALVRLLEADGHEARIIATQTVIMDGKGEIIGEPRPTGFELETNAHWSDFDKVRRIYREASEQVAAELILAKLAE